MHDQPSSQELLEAVKDFIDNTAAPNLKGHAAFHAKVASNAIATVIRDLQQRPVADSQERGRLQNLLQSRETDLKVLNRDLCDMIRSGEMPLSQPGLMTHLKATTIDQLKVDQPNYSGLATALGRTTSSA